jgi:Na+-driven multidrug efflux pump
MIMILLCIITILTDPQYKKYFDIAFFRLFNREGALRIVTLSFPILIDKISLSAAYIWLNKMINPLGKYAIASFSAVKDLERLAFLPAIAFATVITFLVSNRVGAGDLAGARANIKKVLKLGGAMVFTALGIICLNPTFFASIFDTKNKFSGFVGSIFPIISILVVFDFVQLILCGALRGAGDVRAVMVIRFCVCFLFFVPVSYMISLLDIPNEVVKFTLIYGSFYLSTGLIGLLCIARLKQKQWSVLATA